MHTMADAAMHDSCATPAQPRTDRRSQARRKTLLAGKVVFNNRWGALDCIVRDISEGGARIQLDGWLDMPRYIELHLNKGGRYACEIARLGQREMGVRFLEALPQAA